MTHMVREKGVPSRRCRIYKSIIPDAEPAALLGAWNAEAAKMVCNINWDATMQIRATDSTGFGLFVGHGSIAEGTVFAALMGDVALSRLAPTNYDIQPSHGGVYTRGADSQSFECYIRGTGQHEAFNGQLCNHTCAGPNAAFVNLGPVVAGDVAHSLSLPLVGVRALERIAEGSEVVVYYGDQSVSDVPREGFVACRCASCAGAGKYVMG